MSDQPSPPTTQWEYLVRAIPGVGAEEMLNSFGREGWELVNAIGQMFWLKRPLPPRIMRHPDGSITVRIERDAHAK